MKLTLNEIMGKITNNFELLSDLLNNSHQWGLSVKKQYQTDLKEYWIIFELSELCNGVKNKQKTMACLFDPKYVLKNNNNIDYWIRDQILEIILILSNYKLPEWD